MGLHYRMLMRIVCSHCDVVIMFVSEDTKEISNEGPGAQSELDSVSEGLKRTCLFAPIGLV